MKLKALPIAIAAALSAAVPTAVQAQDVSTYIGSASALRNTLARLVARYCQAGTGSIYELSAPPSGTSGADFRAYTCTFRPASDPAVGAQLAAQGLDGRTAYIRHTVSVSAAIGGSIVGVMPIYRNINLQYVNPGAGVGYTTTAVTPAGCSTASVDSVTNFRRYLCPGSEAVRPDWGVSDTEPGLYRAAVNLPSTPPWNAPLGSPGDDLSVQPVPLFVQGFGIAVNTANPISNLSQWQVTALLAGSYDHWGQLGFPAAGPITICRRVRGSGTQATWNVIGLNNPASGAPYNGALTPAAAGDSGPYGNLTVLEWDTTGQVRTCLNANPGAVGILGLDSNNPGAQAWKFVDINGVRVYDPTEPFPSADDGVDPATGTADRIREERIIDGSYTYWVESTAQKRPSISGTVNGFYNLITTNSSDPVITKQLPGVVSLCSAVPVPGQNTPRAANSGASNFTRGGNNSQWPTYCAF